MVYTVATEYSKVGHENTEGGGTELGFPPQALVWAGASYLFMHLE